MTDQLETDRHFGYERQQSILRWLDEAGRVSSAQLAERLNVSIDTVRRDLQELEAAGALKRVHGGAVKPAPGLERFVDRLEEQDQAKAAVAERAAGLFVDGQVVALGGGVTMLELARRLPPGRRVTVVTTSPDVALALRDRPEVEVDLPGGRLHRASQTLTGPDTVDHLRRVRPDVCVVSGCGFHPREGITMRDRAEALVLAAMVEGARRVVVLATAAKLDGANPYLVAGPEQVDVLVTDAEPAALGAYRNLDLEVLTTSSGGSR